MLRFHYQRNVVAAMTEPGDTVIHVGCNNDPGRLKRDFRDRKVVNCDREHQDLGLGYDIEADHYFDCTESWPFADDSAKLVVMGDIIEHLLPLDAVKALEEAHRVGHFLCITCPEDPRFLESETDPSDGKPWQHVTLVTCGLLHWMLARARWIPVDFLTMDYEFVPRGFFCLAQRTDQAALDIYHEIERAHAAQKAKSASHLPEMQVP